MTDPIGIIAGLGQLPVEVARSIQKRGQSVYIVRLKGFVEPALDEFPGEVVGIAEIGKVLKAFKRAGCKQICFSGIVKRPDFEALKPDMKGIRLLPKVIAAARKGDDALLRVMVETFEAEGFEVIGADQAAGELTVASGLLAGPQPTEQNLNDLRKAAHIALEIGRLDIGQGAIVSNGLVLCVEAQEGTDEMLQRCSELPETLRGTHSEPKGVLVKRPKPIQERRIDLPTIGVSTVKAAKQAGLSGIGFEAQGALILDLAAVKERAEALGLFVYAFPEDWV